MQKINPEPVLEVEVLQGAYGFQKFPGVDVATHEEVLPIVNSVTCFEVCERPCPSSKMFPPLNKRYRDTFCGKGNPRSQPGESSTDDNHSGHAQFFRCEYRRLFAQMDAAMPNFLRFPTRMGEENTS